MVIMALIMLFLLGAYSSAAPYTNNYNNEMKFEAFRDHDHVDSRTITVDKSGQGSFTTVQQAIDSVPNNNQLWVRILVKAGIYTEKVAIPQGKQYIFLEGDNKRTTVITWGDGGNAIESTTFTLLADNFVATKITFKNTYNHAFNENARNVTWAPAALIAADKVSFYGCAFISVQDTLGDATGRHYFESCYIEGAVDFIWGNGQSFYEKCNLNVTRSLLGAGHNAYITAQGRETAKESSGFVFRFNNVFGTGPAYLGRAYRQYSRVLFYRTHMDNIIAPQGWSAWQNVGHEDLITFVEVGCFGPGSRKSGRVKWEKKLPVREWTKLTNVNSFINQDGWMQMQPIKPKQM